MALNFESLVVASVARYKAAALPEALLLK